MKRTVDWLNNDDSDSSSEHEPPTTSRSAPMPLGLQAKDPVGLLPEVPPSLPPPPEAPAWKGSEPFVWDSAPGPAFPAPTGLDFTLDHEFTVPKLTGLDFSHLPHVSPPNARPSAEAGSDSESSCDVSEAPPVVMAQPRAEEAPRPKVGSAPSRTRWVILCAVLLVLAV